MTNSRPDSTARRRSAGAFGAGALIGTLGGLIGLGGAEFRLPVLIGWFRFVALEAIILNKATSIVVVASALLFRTKTVPLDTVLAHGAAVVNLLAGSLAGAWCAAGWATRMRSTVLYRVMAGLLVLIAAVLLFGHDPSVIDAPALQGISLIVAGLIVGFGIGMVASLLGVAGGELLIPALILLYGIDIKTAGSLSLVVSLPTILVGFARYSRDASFAVLGRHRSFVIVMAAGSIVGTFVGGLLLGIVPSGVLLPLLSTILLVSAWKVWKHQ